MLGSEAATLRETGGLQLLELEGLREGLLLSELWADAEVWGLPEEPTLLLATEV